MAAFRQPSGQLVASTRLSAQSGDFWQEPARTDVYGCVMSIRAAYDMWAQYNRRLRDVIAAMTDEQLAIRPSPDGMPIWATVGHTAGARAYWLCEVAGEPGAETTPFAVPITEGWEDDLDHPRGADELVHALDSTFAVVQGCLDRWTLDMLGEEIRRDYAGTSRVHTRASILQRLFSHDAYHCGELSQTLGIHGLPQIDLWAAD
jgi:uncharacterized damage-inducible protein DinB